MSGYSLGVKSINMLVGVHPDLVRIVRRAIEVTSQDFLVLEGVRTHKRQLELYGKGRTRDELRSDGVDPALAQPGVKPVTWTLKSNHFVQADGYGHAVDLAPYPVDWDTLSKFDAIADAMAKVAEELGIAIRHGADWDMDGKRRERGESDNPHFELAPR